MKGFGLKLFFGHCPMEGPKKSPFFFLSLCWSVSPSAVQHLTED